MKKSWRWAFCGSGRVLDAIFLMILRKMTARHLHHREYSRWWRRRVWRLRAYLFSCSFSFATHNIVPPKHHDGISFDSEPLRFLRSLRSFVTHLALPPHHMLRYYYYLPSFGVASSASSVAQSETMPTPSNDSNVGPSNEMEAAGEIPPLLPATAINACNNPTSTRERNPMGDISRVPTSSIVDSAVLNSASLFSVLNPMQHTASSLTLLYVVL